MRINELIVFAVVATIVHRQGRIDSVCPKVPVAVGARDPGRRAHDLLTKTACSVLWLPHYRRLQRRTTILTYLRVGAGLGVGQLTHSAVF